MKTVSNKEYLDTLSDLCKYDWMRSGMLQSAAEGEVGAVMTSVTQNMNIDRSDAGGFNALIVASQNGHLETVRFLLENGASVEDIWTEDGVTALMMAAQENHLEILQMLIENAKGSVNARADNGSTALCMASYNGHLEVCRELLKHGALRTLGHVNGELPCLSASSGGHSEVVLLLLREDCEEQVNCRRDDGATPLLVAAICGYVEVIRALLLNGADINAKRNDGKDALSLALAGRKTDAVNLLREQLTLGVVRSTPKHKAVVVEDDVEEEEEEEDF